MKKILLIVICPMVFAACSKNAAPGSTTIITNQHQDTLTLTDDGHTFFNTSNGNSEVGCSINKTASNSTFTLRTFNTLSFPVSMLMGNIPGPLNGLGVYKIAPIDSPTGGFGWEFQESFPGGISYGVDSLIINVTTADRTTVKGNYTLWLRDDTSRKTVTGIFNIYNANID